MRESVPPPPSIVPAAPFTRLLQQSRLVTSIPLKTKLLLVVRAPFTLGEIEALSFERSSLMSADTPGSITRSWVKLRAEVGKDSSSFRSSVRIMVEEVEDTIPASALTSMASAIVPTSRAALSVTISAVVTVTPSRRSGLKPGISKVTR